MGQTMSQTMSQTTSQTMGQIMGQIMGRANCFVHPARHSPRFSECAKRQPGGKSSVGHGHQHRQPSNWKHRLGAGRVCFVGSRGAASGSVPEENGRSHEYKGKQTATDALVRSETLPPPRKCAKPWLPV
ncbi:hypothetical protein DCS_03516 [Drechmeria coniospora]|uniref:Uncharacterized protein n=1 Tax=Drechmeria coniospora TaxID=98403 RepID=A0A151GHF5_DRECN|nr:hypothetical protein DCS_03516 [Drechmeria coniospora]KYK56516.1 hypothetical protein DCS_03516 [Drechmeria coniospora]